MNDHFMLQDFCKTQKHSKHRYTGQQWSQSALSIQCWISVVQLECIGGNSVCGRYEGVTVVLMTCIGYKCFTIFMYCLNFLTRTV